MINSVRLRHFRSYTDDSFEFDKGVNIIVGPNASGKTNLLEAILVLCRGKSYRANDLALVQHKSTWTKVDGVFKGGERSLVIKAEDSKVNKEYVLGSTKIKRLTHKHGIPVVLFEPSHMQLLTDSPGLRRDFIDDVVEQTKPAFGSVRRQYKRVLAQRNKLLKNNSGSKELFIWDIRLSELGGEIMRSRLEFVENNQDKLNKLYKKLAGKKHKASLEYKTELKGKDPTSSILKSLQKNSQTDKILGFTTTGPHRDDIMPLLNEHEIIGGGSRGETRTMLLALKLLELEAVEQSTEQKPILLLDDVFSELDGARRRALTNYLKDHQTFITTTDADIVVQHFLDKCRVIPLGR